MQLRIASSISETGPFVWYENGTWQGTFIWALQLICKRLNTTCNITHVPMKVTAPNTPFYGPLAAVMTGEADLAVYPVGISKDRSQQLDFINSYFNKVYVVLINKNKLLPTAVGSTGAFSPLHIADLHVWISIAMSIVLLVLALTVSLMIKIRFVTPDLKDGFSYKRLFLIVVFRTLALTFGQETLELPYKNVRIFNKPMAILSATVFVFSFLIMQSLSGTLTNLFCIRTSDALPFNSTGSFENTDFSLQGTLQSQVLLKESFDRVAKRIGERMTVVADASNYVHTVLESARSDSNSAVILSTDGLDAVATTGRALFGAKCPALVIAIEPLVSAQVSIFIFPKESLYKELFELEYSYLFEKGFINAFFKNEKGKLSLGYGRNATLCQPEKYSPKSVVAFGPLKLRSLMSCIIFFFALLGIALLIHVTEFYPYKTL